MAQKTDETKVLRDPIHGYIHVNDQVIWECINAREFQRLHRIHQLGGDFQVYHTAEHSRFSHSLGVYEITRRMISEVQSLSQALSEEEKIAHQKEQKEEAKKQAQNDKQPELRYFFGDEKDFPLQQAVKILKGEKFITGFEKKDEKAKEVSQKSSDKKH